MLIFVIISIRINTFKFIANMRKALNGEIKLNMNMLTHIEKRLREFWPMDTIEISSDSEQETPDDNCENNFIQGQSNEDRFRNKSLPVVPSPNQIFILEDLLLTPPRESSDSYTPQQDPLKSITRKTSTYNGRKPTINIPSIGQYFIKTLKLKPSAIYAKPNPDQIRETLTIKYKEDINKRVHDPKVQEKKLLEVTEKIYKNYHLKIAQREKLQATKVIDPKSTFSSSEKSESQLKKPNKTKQAGFDDASEILYQSDDDDYLPPSHVFENVILPSTTRTGKELRPRSNSMCIKLPVKPRKIHNKTTVPKEPEKFANIPIQRSAKPMKKRKVQTKENSNISENNETILELREKIYLYNDDEDHLLDPIMSPVRKTKSRRKTVCN